MRHFEILKWLVWGVCSFTFFHFSNFVFAAESKPFEIGAGVLGTNLMRVSTESSGQKGFYSEFNPIVQLAYTIEERFQARLAGTPLGNALDDDAGNKRFFLLDLNYRHPIQSGLNLKGGMGVMLVMISGAGGTSLQNNGVTTTTFGLPSQTSTSKNFYINFGADYAVTPEIKVFADVIIPSILTSRRAFNLLVGASMGVL